MVVLIFIILPYTRSGTVAQCCGYTVNSIHSAWSELSAACPRPRGGHWKGEKVARGAFVTLQRRGLCFRAKAAKEARGEARRAEPTNPFLVASDQKRQILALVVSPQGCFQGNQYVTLSSSVLFGTIALQQTVLPPSRVLILCAIARKSLIMTDFSKTGSRNMAETCEINFLTLVSYSTSIVLGGLWQLLLPVLMWAGVDFKYFRAETARCSFRVFCNFDRSWNKN